MLDEVDEVAEVEAGKHGAVERERWLMFGAAPDGVEREEYETQARARFRERFGEDAREVWWWTEQWLYVGPVMELEDDRTGAENGGSG